MKESQVRDAEESGVRAIRWSLSLKESEAMQYAWRELEEGVRSMIFRQEPESGARYIGSKESEM